MVGETKAIYDTGTTQIIGDPQGIAQLYAPLMAFGARPSPADGVGIYTSTWACDAVDWAPHNV